MKSISNAWRHAGLWCRVLLCVGAGVPGVPAQEVEALRKSYEEEVGKTVLPLREGYRKALLALEQSLAAKGNYPDAKRVQDERREVEKQMGQAGGGSGPATAGLEPDGRVKLKAGALASGGLKEESGVWKGWETAGGALRWALPAGLRSGGYTLELVYRSAGAGILPLMVREDFHALERSVKVDAAPEGEARVRLGVLRVRPGATIFELKLTAPATAADFRLVEASLIPEGGAS
jgi:hypothetical protein